MALSDQQTGPILKFIRRAVPYGGGPIKLIASFGCGGPQSPKSTCLTFEVDVLPVPIWSENPSSDAKSGNWVGIDVGIC